MVLSPDLKVSVHALATFLIGELSVRLRLRRRLCLLARTEMERRRRVAGAIKREGQGGSERLKKRGHSKWSTGPGGPGGSLRPLPPSSARDRVRGNVVVV